MASDEQQELIRRLKTLRKDLSFTDNIATVTDTLKFLEAMPEPTVVLPSEPPKLVAIVEPTDQERLVELRVALAAMETAKVEERARNAVKGQIKELAAAIAAKNICASLHSHDAWTRMEFRIPTGSLGSAIANEVYRLMPKGTIAWWLRGDLLIVHGIRDTPQSTR